MRWTVRGAQKDGVRSTLGSGPPAQEQAARDAAGNIMMIDLIDLLHLSRAAAGRILITVRITVETPGQPFLPEIALDPKLAKRALREAIHLSVVCGSRLHL